MPHKSHIRLGKVDHRLCNDAQDLSSAAITRPQNSKFTTKCVVHMSLRHHCCLPRNKWKILKDLLRTGWRMIEKYSDFQLQDLRYAKDAGCPQLPDAEVHSPPLPLAKPKDRFQLPEKNTSFWHLAAFNSSSRSQLQVGGMGDM